MSKDKRLSHSVPFSADAAQLDPVQLSQHIEWLRRLARGLVRDMSLAEDLVQETALAALESPPALAGGSPRPWLAKVLRHRAADAARRASGDDAARAVRRSELEATGETGAVVGRLDEVETGKRLAELVLKLGEPTRSTVLMRFWDDLPPRKIAQRQGIPVATVKSRLARGLDHLRSELDSRNGGDRSAWLLAVLPMARKNSGVTMTTLGGIGMQAKLITMTGAATLLGGTLYFMAPAQEVERSTVDPAGLAETLDISDTALEMDRGDPKRSALDVGVENVDSDSRGLTEFAAAPSIESATAYSVAGIVLGADGRHVVGVPIQARGGDFTTMSDASGRFELEVFTPSGQLETSTEAGDWVTVRPGTFREDAAEDPLLIVARAIDLRGVVADEWGAAAPGVEMILDLPADFVNRFDSSHAKSIRQDWRAVSGADGMFSFDNVPSVLGATLEATRSNGTSVRIFAPSVTRDDLRLEFPPVQIPPGSRLEGRVLYPDGTGASGAYVAMGFETIRADEDGRFALDLRATGKATRLLASTKGFQPAESKSDDAKGGTNAGWPESLELRLRTPSLVLEGRVVDVLGEPQPGARVWLRDATDFGVMGTFPLTAEGIAGGLEDPVGARRSRGRLAAAREPTDESSATGVEGPNSMLPYVVTNGGGEFKIHGLLDRSYVLNIIGPNLSYAMQSEPLRAGRNDVVIERPEGGVFAEVRGRIVTRRGDPLPNVFITPWIAGLDKTQSVRGGSSSITRFFYAKGVATDADGYFLLMSVPKRRVQFWIAGEGVTPLSMSVEEIGDPAELLIEMAARTEVSVEISDPASGIDRVTAQGFSGESMSLSRIYADGSSTVESLDVENGRTGVFALTTDAATLTLMRGDYPVEVIDLDGSTDSVQRIVY